MRILIVSDAWHPQVNGVVVTLEMLALELRGLGHVVEVIGPDRFRTVAMPGYRSIQLAVTPARRLVPLIEAFDPEALHVATEGPLGWAARRWALRTGTKFTTSFHTRFPEYLHARGGVPLSLSYAFLRGFHGRAQGTMVATGSMRKELADRGFRNLLPWSRGVDSHRFRPGDREDWQWPRPIFLYVGRLAIEKNVARFLALDLPGTKVVVGDGPQRAALEQAYPCGKVRRRAARRRADPSLCRRRRLRVPVRHRHVRPGPARKPGLRHPDRRAAGHRPRPISSPMPTPASARSIPTCAPPRCRRSTATGTPAAVMPSASPGGPAPKCSAGISPPRNAGLPSASGHATAPRP